MAPASRGPALKLLKHSPAFPTAFTSVSSPVQLRRPFICAQCTRKLLPAYHYSSSFVVRASTPTRFFHNTPHPLKKASGSKKSNRKSPEISSPDVDRHVPDNKASLSRDAEPDPYDYSELQAAIDKAISRLQDNLSKTRDAGRVSVQMLEALPVELNVKGGDVAKGATPHKERSTVGGVASVVPKGGRAMQVFCADEAHVKPVYSALQASDYSLTPQLADANEANQLVITVPVPPVTAETRAQAASEARKVAEKAGLEVRNARGDAQKRFRKMELQKVVVVDELRKAHKGMEEVSKKGQEEVKRVLEAALKGLER